VAICCWPLALLAACISSFTEWCASGWVALAGSAGKPTPHGSKPPRKPWGVSRPSRSLARRARTRTFSRHLAANDTLSQVPLYLVEATGYAGLVALVLVLAWRGDDLGQILPVIGLYSFAAYRMLPAAQFVYRGFARLRFGAAALDHIHRDLHLPQRSHAPPAPPWKPEQHIRLAANRTHTD